MKSSRNEDVEASGHKNSVEHSGERAPVWRVPLLDPLARRIEAVFAFVGGVMIVAMMALITVDSLSRYFLNSPLAGATEVTTQILMVGAVWLFMAPTERVEGHVSIDVLMRRMPVQIQLWSALVTRIASAYIVGLIAWATFYKTQETWGSVTTGVLTLPVGPTWGMVTAGAGLLTLRLVLKAVDDLGRIVQQYRGAARPDAVDTENQTSSLTRGV